MLRRLSARVLIVAALLLGPLAWQATVEEARLFALSAEDGRVRWSAGLAADLPAVGAPIAAGGRVVVGSADSEPQPGRDRRWKLAAFDAANGRPLWEFAPAPRQFGDLYALDTVLIQPFVGVEGVYAIVKSSRGASLLALDAATGRLAWTFSPVEAQGPLQYPRVALAAGGVVVPTSEADSLALVALDARSGTPTWRGDLAGRGLPSTFGAEPLLVANGRSVFLGTRAAVDAFDAETGALRYTLAVEGGQLWSDGSTLYRGGDGRQSIAAFDAATGEHRWTWFQPFRDGRSFLGPFRAAEERLYALCHCEGEGEYRYGGWLLAVDARDGRERWRTPVEAFTGLLGDAPAIASEMVILGSEDDDVVARAEADGAEHWRFRREHGRAAATDGHLVFATDRAPRWRTWLAYLNPAWR